MSLGERLSRRAFFMTGRRPILLFAMLFLLPLMVQLEPLTFAINPNISSHVYHFSTSTPDTDVQLEWPLNNSYFISIDLKVIASPETQTSIFWGHQFTFMNGEKGYVGFGIGGDVKVVTIAIFDAMGANTNSSSGRCETGVPFSIVGIGWQCFDIYDWRIGFNYGLRVTQLPSDNQGNGRWQGSIHDYSTNSDTIVGTITVPSEFGMLGSLSSTWDEYSIAQTCATADTSVIFSSPFAGNVGGNHAPLKAQVTYGNTTCQDSNVRYLGGGAYQADAGQNVTRTAPSQTWLWTQEPAITPQNPQNIVTSTMTSVATSTSASGSTSATTADSSTLSSTSMAETSSVATASSATSREITSAFVSTPIETTNIVSASEESTAASSSIQTPIALPAIPGFPWESIITGIIVGLVVLAILRRTNRTAALSQ